LGEGAQTACEGMIMRDDQELLVALRRRDGEAFTYLFEMYADKIYRLALRLLENETEADGVVQDTFLRLLSRLDQFEGRSKVGTWLYRVAYNICVDRYTRQTDHPCRPSPTLIQSTSAGVPRFRKSRHVTRSWSSQFCNLLCPCFV